MMKIKFLQAIYIHKNYQEKLNSKMYLSNILQEMTKCSKISLLQFLKERKQLLWVPQEQENLLSSNYFRGFIMNMMEKYYLMVKIFKNLILINTENSLELFHKNQLFSAEQLKKIFAMLKKVSQNNSLEILQKKEMLQILLSSMMQVTKNKLIKNNY